MTVRASARAFSENSIAVAESIARNASRSLRLAVRIAHLTDNTKNLHAAMETRTPPCLFELAEPEADLVAILSAGTDVVPASDLREHIARRALDETVSL